MEIYADTKWAHARALNSLVLQITIHGGADSLLLDAERSPLLGYEVCLKPRWPLPDVRMARAIEQGWDVRPQ